MDKLTNTRREDIIKAAKFHYNVDGRGTKLDYIRAVICLHNGVERDNLKDHHVMSVLLAETADEVLANTGKARILIGSLVRTHELNRFMMGINGEEYSKKNDGMALLMDEYIRAICFLKVSELKDKSLPENCQTVKDFSVKEATQQRWDY